IGGGGHRGGGPARARRGFFSPALFKRAGGGGGGGGAPPAAGRRGGGAPGRGGRGGTGRRGGRGGAGGRVVQPTPARADGWVGMAAARFADHVITLGDLEDVRAQASALDRKLVQARGQARQLDAKRTVGEQKSAGELAAAYTDAAADLVRAEARVRAGDAW